MAINPVQEVQHKVQVVIHDLRHELEAAGLDIEISVEPTADGVQVRVEKTRKSKPAPRVISPSSIAADDEEAVG